MLLTGSYLSSDLHYLHLINPLAYAAFSGYSDNYTMQAEHVTRGP